MARRTRDKNEVNLITEELFREAYQYEEVRKPPLKSVIAKFFRCTKDSVFKFIPIARWLSKYNFKSDIVNDLVAGVTVAVMHVPHGLAYAPLGRVAPVVGFYMAIFPVFVYMIFGTSRHISIGTFAVLCAMVGHITMKHGPKERDFPSFFKDINVTSETSEATYKEIEIGTAVCLLVGVWQAALGFLRLGSLTVILSESLVSGFTAGAAIHVLSYQLKNLFGVKVATFSGAFKLIYIYIDFFSKIKTVNLVTMSISIACIAILLLFNEYLKPLIQRKYPKNKIPIPIELTVIVIGILVSYFAELKQTFNVGIVGNIPKGFPKPLAPPLALLPRLILDSLIVALVALAINLSLARIFAKKGYYKVFSNQEFIAYGAANIFACFFHCLPSAASLSRSSIQFSVGGKTQLASLFSACLIIFILLFAGPLFEPVPYCVLSSIVAVTLKSLIMQICDLCSIWRQSYWDGIVWLGTFLAVVILDLDYGLGVGIVLSLITIIFISFSFRVSVLGRVPETNIFLDVDHFKMAQPVPNILILQIIGSLNFSNANRLEIIVSDYFDRFSGSVGDKLPYVVVNMSSVTKIDPTAVNSLRHVSKYLNKNKSELYLTDCNVEVYRMFEVCNLYSDIPKEQILASVVDAVEYLASNNQHD